MSKYGYEGSEQFKPISAWGYVGYSILFCIPIVGWIIWIVFAFSSKNLNRRSYARSFFCRFLLLLIAIVLLCLLAYFNGNDFRENLKQWNIPYVNEVLEQIDKWLPSHANSSSRTTTTRNTAISTTESNSKKEVSVSLSTTTGVRAEIKEAIDSYEVFFKEYADFMKKYKTSTNALSMMSDYMSMMSRYADNMEKWEKLENDYEMNDAELKYYAEATLRINRILVDAAY